LRNVFKNHFGIIPTIGLSFFFGRKPLLPVTSS
jgi:hypothetical protein